MSRRITVTLSDELDEQLPYDDFDSKSQTVVSYIERGFMIEEKEAEIEQIKAERDDLRRQLREVNRRQREVGELVEYVDEQRKREQKREEKENSPAWRRAKWWLLGYDPDRDG